MILVLRDILLIAVVLATAAASEPAQPGEVDLGSGPGGLLVRGGDQAQVVDPGRGRRGRGGLGDGPGHVPAGGERGGRGRRRCPPGTPRWPAGPRPLTPAPPPPPPGPGGARSAFLPPG